MLNPATWLRVLADTPFLSSHDGAVLRAAFRQLQLEHPAFLSHAKRTSEPVDARGSLYRQALHIDGRRDLNFTVTFRDVRPGAYSVTWRLQLQPGWVRGYASFKARFAHASSAGAARSWLAPWWHAPWPVRLPGALHAGEAGLEEEDAEAEGAQRTKAWARPALARLLRGGCLAAPDAVTPLPRGAAEAAAEAARGAGPALPGPRGAQRVAWPAPAEAQPAALRGLAAARDGAAEIQPAPQPRAPPRDGPVLQRALGHASRVATKRDAALAAAAQGPRFAPK
jgi:hypothetical protein